MLPAQAVIVIDRPKEVECSDPCDNVEFVKVVGRRRGLEVGEGSKDERGEVADGYLSGAEYAIISVQSLRFRWCRWCRGFVGWIWLDITL